MRDATAGAMPLVSVIVPIYNHAPYVAGCLDSVARQGYERIEVIAIDDGSKDASHEIARDWLAAHGRRFERSLLLQQPNQGITRTFNRLVSLSRGGLVFPLASDDEATAGGISALVAACDPQQPEVLFSDVEIMDMQGTTIAASGAHWRGRDLRRLANSPWFLGWQLVTAWGTPFQHQFFPRALFEELGGYDESLKFEDAAFALRAAARKRVRFVPVTTRRYRVRPDAGPSPGIAASDWTMIPTRRAVGAEYGAMMRGVLRLLDLRDRTSRRWVRRAIGRLLTAVATAGRLLGK
jgi:glycosyltransferase involved in cell wall biosynthesis